MPKRSHGDTGTKLYMAWLNMKARCNRKSAREYSNYGGRGIKVCDEWLHSYETFKEWAMSNGYNDKLTLDRINVDGNYCPKNCRWITNKEQQNNKRNNVVYTYNGETKTLAEWSECLGICYKTLQKRIKNWGVDRAFTTPIKTEFVIDITGQKFGRLTVLKLENIKKGANFKCLCDCGNVVITKGYNIRTGKVISCGCWQREKAKEMYKGSVKARIEKANNKIIRCYSKDGQFVNEYKGVSEASEKVGISKSMIWRALNEPNFTAKGMRWIYG